MNENFNAALKLVLAHEGGFVNHPSDPGGATNLGITIATYRAYLNPNGTVDDLKRLTVEQAGICYRKNYWNAVSGDDLPSGIDYAVFDFAINSGPDRAAKYLQTSLNVAADGRIGNQTLTAARSADAATVINNLCDMRLTFLKAIKAGAQWKVFGRGWGSRVAGVRSAALGMVKAPPSIKPPPVVIPSPAPIPEPEPIPGGWIAALITALAAALKKGQTP